MKFLKIRTASNEGTEIDFNIYIPGIDFAVREALQPWTIAMDKATFKVPELTEQKLLDGGMIEMQTSEGVSCYVNINRLVGYFTPQLGIYVLKFNDSQLGVSATQAEMTAKFDVASSLEL